MHVIGTNVHLMNYDLVQLSGFDKRGFDEICIGAFHERLSIFWTPLKMKLI